MKRLIPLAIASLLLATPAWAQERSDTSKHGAAGTLFTAAGVGLLTAAAGVGLAAAGGRCMNIMGNAHCNTGETMAFTGGVFFVVAGALTTVVGLVGGFVLLVMDAARGREASARRERRWVVAPQVTPRGDVGLGVSWRF